MYDDNLLHDELGTGYFNQGLLNRHNYGVFYRQEPTMIIQYS